MIGNHSGFHVMTSCHLMMDLNTYNAEENTFQENVFTAGVVELELIKNGEK